MLLLKVISIETKPVGLCNYYRVSSTKTFHFFYYNVNNLMHKALSGHVYIECLGAVIVSGNVCVDLYSPYDLINLFY